MQVRKYTVKRLWEKTTTFEFLAKTIFGSDCVRQCDVRSVYWDDATNDRFYYILGRNEAFDNFESHLTRWEIDHTSKTMIGDVMWWVVVRIEWEENFAINYYKQKVDIVKICNSYDHARLVTENDASFYKTIDAFQWNGDRSYYGETEEKASGFTKGVKYEIRQTE